MKGNTILLSVLFLIISCQSTEVEDPNFIGRDKEKYISAKEGESKTLLKEILEKQTEFLSFKSEFSMLV